MTHFAAWAPVATLWLCSFMSTRQIYEYFMMMVDYSVPMFFYTSLFNLVYIWAFGTTYDNLGSVGAAAGMTAYTGLVFVF